MGSILDTFPVSSPGWWRTSQQWENTGSDGCWLTLLEASWPVSEHTSVTTSPSFSFPQQEHKRSREVTRTRRGTDSAAFKLLPISFVLPSKHVESRGGLDHPSREVTPQGPPFNISTCNIEAKVCFTSVDQSRWPLRNGLHTTSLHYDKHTH